MFKLFKKQTEEEKLQKQYDKLMGAWHSLSSTNRALSDKKYAQAQKVLDRIVELRRN